MKVLLLIIFLISSSLAFHSDDKKTKAHSEIFLDKSLDKIEEELKRIYRQLNSTSKTIDEYLTNQTDEKLYTASYIRIETSVEKRESNSVDFEPNVDIRIRLPKLKEKLSITIDNDDDRIHNVHNDSNEKINYKDNDYNVGLLYNTIKNDINLKFKLGVKISSNPYVYAKAEAGKYFAFSENNGINIEQKLKYSDRDELDNYSSIEYILNIDENYKFYNYNEYYINSELKDNNMYNSFRLYNILPNNKHLNYVAAINSNDDNTNFQVKEYTTYVSYRSFIREWLYYDVIPSVSWDRADDFDETFAIKLNLGILIAK